MNVLFKIPFFCFKVHESVNICLNAINQTLDEIKFPETTQECIVKAADFKCRNNYPGIVGAIDGRFN